MSAAENQTNYGGIEHLATIARCCHSVLVEAPFRGVHATAEFRVTGEPVGRTDRLHIIGHGNSLRAAVLDFIRIADEAAPGWSTSAVARARG